MPIHERLIEGLPEETQRLVQTYSKEVKAALGDRLEGLLIYGSAVRGEFLPGRSNLNMVLIVTEYKASTLNAYAPVHKRWSKEQVVAPLFLTEREIVATSALFPLEFLELQEHHRVLGGRDPFVGFHVPTDRLKDQVVQGLSGHVLRLRQRYVEGGGMDDAVTILLPLTITSTVPLLRGVQRVRGRSVLTESMSVIQDVAASLSLDLRGLQDALLLKRGQITPGPSEIPRLFDRYLQGVTALAEAALRF